MIALVLALACSSGSQEIPASGWESLGDFGPGSARQARPISALPEGGSTQGLELRTDPYLDTTDLVRLPGGILRTQMCGGGDLRPDWSEPWLTTHWNVGTRGQVAWQALREDVNTTPTLAASATPQLHSTQPRLVGGPGGRLILTWSEGHPWGIGLGARVWDGTAWSAPADLTATLAVGEPDESGLLGEASCALPAFTERGPEVRFRWDPGCAAGLQCTPNHQWTPSQGVGDLTEAAVAPTPEPPEGVLPPEAVRSVLAKAPDGRRAVAWEALTGHAREVFVRIEQDDAWVGLSGSDQDRGVSRSDSHSVQPALAFTGDRLCVAWSEMHDGPAEILVRCHDLPEGTR